MSVFDHPIVMLDFETTGLSPAMADFFKGGSVAVGVAQGGTIRGVDVREDHATVFHGRQLGLHRRKYQQGGPGANQHHGNHQPARLQQPASHAA